VRLTLTEGKYHQVKRMVAAVGNRVETLHRSADRRLAAAARLGAGTMALVLRPRIWPSVADGPLHWQAVSKEASV